MPVTYVPRGPKRPVNMTLSEDLVREARSLTTNPSDTVDKLLGDHVEAQKKKCDEKARLIDESIRMIQAHHEEFGLWGEEFSTL
jgi:antitoxin CcdA